MNKSLLAAVLALTLTASAQTVTPTTIPADTEVVVRFAQTVDSGQARVGDRIEFTVSKPVTVNGVTIIPEGASALGTVTVAKPKRWAGRAGQLGWSIDSVTLPSGQKVLLRGSTLFKADGHGTAVTAGVTAAAVALPIAAPFVLMVHGHNEVVAAGTQDYAFVDHDTVITAAK